MTQLYLIRHGAYQLTETSPVEDGGLSSEGIRQAERLRERLVATQEIKADVLISSDLPRAKQTAEIIAPAFGLPILYDSEVQEWRNHDGSQESENLGQKLREIASDQRPYYPPYPGGETWAQFAFRACQALNRISMQNVGKSIVIVCHGGIIEAAFLFAFGLSPLQPTPIMMMVDPTYTSITYWHKLSIGLWRLMRYNDDFHLRSI